MKKGKLKSNLDNNFPFYFIFINKMHHEINDLLTLHDIHKSGQINGISNTRYHNSEGENMTNTKCQALNGKDNKRLNNLDRFHSDMTEARCDIAYETKESKVNIPDANNIINSKEWVDNGSKL